ncbi:transposase [Dyadobacter frigoris]|uniref:transposase n=1 Tax=Dyadobacter frigoris TaxID=2576211 RepID=UPI001485AFA4
MDWSFFDGHVKKHYKEDSGRPTLSIRLVVSLLISKHVRNLSDENIVEQWAEKAYYQYFNGD